MKEMETPDTTQAASSTVQTTVQSTVQTDTGSTPEAVPTAVSESAAPPLSADQPSGGQSSAEQSSPDQLKERIVEQLKTVFDPEIPVNIYEMGLIYDIDVDPDGATRIRMTLTTPMCPAAEELPAEVEGKARDVEGVTSIQLDLVWEPPWTPDMMSEAARLELGMT